jgi:hypothetical protein
MRRINVWREYEVVLPTRGSPMWRALEKIIVDDALSTTFMSMELRNKAKQDAAEILASDEAVATWLTFQCDVGNYELGPDEPTEGTFGAEMIDANGYDATMYKLVLEPLDEAETERAINHNL